MRPSLISQKGEIITRTKLLNAERGQRSTAKARYTEKTMWGVESPSEEGTPCHEAE